MGRTALHSAASESDEDLARALNKVFADEKERRAYVQIEDVKNHTAYDYVVMEGFFSSGYFF